MAIKNKQQIWPDVRVTSWKESSAYLLQMTNIEEGDNPLRETTKLS
jgi:hypothetical protein